MSNSFKSDTAVDMMRDIVDFHEKFKRDYDGPPRIPPADLLWFRLHFQNEEHGELHDAIQTKDEEKFLDALADTIYVALGTAYVCGYHFAEAWRRVHAANMAKVIPENGIKIAKPAGWQPPDLSDLISGDEIPYLRFEA